jgi:hypothetical protein
MIFLKKVGCFWFLASEKWSYGTEMGLVSCFGSKMKPAELVSDLHQRCDGLGFREPHSKDEFYAA